jgi:hypothetical protein
MQTQTALNVAHFPERFKNWIDLASAWRTLMANQRSSYHPEKHYMRGPGPKCREKHAQHCDTAN